MRRIRAASGWLQRLVRPVASPPDDDNQRCKHDEDNSGSDDQLAERCCDASIWKHKWPGDTGYEEHYNQKPHIPAILCWCGRNKARIAASLGATLQPHDRPKTD